MNVVKLWPSVRTPAILMLAVLSSCTIYKSGPETSPGSSAVTTPSTTAEAQTELPECVEPSPKIPIKHVFLIVLENKSFEITFADDSPLRQLSTQGILLPNYWGVGHNSLDNYIALVSGQAPNPITQMDCPLFVDFVTSGKAEQQFRRMEERFFRTVKHAISQVEETEGRAVEKTAGLVHEKRAEGPNGQLLISEDHLQDGAGCVYPNSVRTIADQLEEKSPGRGWRAYMEGMSRRCEHPDLGHIDTTAFPHRSNPQQYTPRHNPFVYFHSLIGSGKHPHGTCDQYDRPLGDLDPSHDGLAGDLKNNDIPSFVFISPNLCDDGHSDCMNPDEKDPNARRAHEMAQINHFVPKLVSVIKGSAAYQDGGLIIVTFDEAEVPKRAETLHYLPEDEEQDTDTNAASDWNRSCCDEQPGPGWRDPGLTGPGGGRVGAILISPFIRENSRPDEHPYNHYSLLRTLEDLFDLHKKDEGAVEHLGYANQDGLKTFQSCHLFNQVPVSKPQPVINTQ